MSLLEILSNETVETTSGHNCDNCCLTISVKVILSVVELAYLKSNAQ